MASDEKDVSIEEALQGLDFIERLLKGAQKLRPVIIHIRQEKSILQNMASKQAALDKDIAAKTAKAQALDEDIARLEQLATQTAQQAKESHQALLAKQDADFTDKKDRLERIIADLKVKMEDAQAELARTDLAKKRLEEGITQLKNLQIGEATGA